MMMMMFLPAYNSYSFNYTRPYQKNRVLFLVLLLITITTRKTSLITAFPHQQRQPPSSSRCKNSRVHPDFQQLQQGNIIASRGKGDVTTSLLLSSSSIEEEESSHVTPTTTFVPKIIFRFNASTKWIITILHTLTLVLRPYRYEGPYLIFGSIVSTYFTKYLKQIINQGRPNGAPFTDPGMPSSHSLISFFIASSWTPIIWRLCSTVTTTTTSTTTFLTSLLSSKLSMTTILKMSSLWIGAIIVAFLRVVCGYHTWSQITVGAGLGILLGTVWTTIGYWMYQLYPKRIFYISWICYVTGAILFISTHMKDWLTHEKHL